MPHRAFIVFLLLANLAVGAGWEDVPSFPMPAWFRSQWRSSAPQVRLEEPRHLSDYVTDNEIELSLRAFIELVLENNTDVALARLQVLLPENGVVRSLAAFDPTLQASFNRTHITEPTTSALQGAPTLRSLSQPLTFSYQQLLQTGSTVSVNFNGERDFSNSDFALFNPAITSSLSAQFSHPLLRNRGAAITRRTILIARSTLKAGRYELENQLRGLIANAENAYWDLVQAAESLNVENRFVALRLAALDRAQKQVNDGALLPIDLFQAQGDYATAKIALIQARRTLARAENTVRKDIGADRLTGAGSLPIVATEPVETPVLSLPGLEELVSKALAARPDRRETVTTIEGADLNIQNALDSLRPNLLLTGNYGSNGLGGVLISNPVTGGLLPTPVIGGVGDALRQLFSFSAPTYALGLQLTLPVRDHAAAADLADATVRKRMDLLQLQRMDESIRLDVANALSDVDAAAESVRQGQAAAEYAKLRFQAEQKKYDRGVTQLFFLLDAQTQFNQAESDLLQQQILYRRAIVSLYLATGDLLAELGIAVQ